MKVAIVHDWLIGGGAELVVYELHKMYPNAPIYTSYCSDEWREKLGGKVVTGYLQRWPFSKLRKFLPILRIWWFTHLDFSGFDLVISSSGNGEAKGVRTPKGVKHICYCHTPTHFYWRHYEQYVKTPGFGIFNPLARFGLRLLAGPLRRWDFKAAQRPDFFIANSDHIKNDIKRYYQRDAIVIHPPVSIEKFNNLPIQKRQGLVTVGRLVPYKRVDLIVQACNKLNLNLTVVGRGPEYQNLVKLAGPNVTFDNNAGDEDVAKYLTRAEAFLFAAEEDFGVTPVEALAAGTPVIAYKAGGALDYIEPKVNGLFFENQTVGSLVEALKEFPRQNFNHHKILSTANKFGTERFEQEMQNIVVSIF